MNTALMFSKASDEWATPREFWEPLHAEFGFEVDAAASRHNTFCRTWFGLDTDDALTTDWVGDFGPGPYWLNPPYSKCREFMEKASYEANRGATVVCLVPSRTDTRWWHEHVYFGDGLWWPGVEVRFIKGRLKFGTVKNSAPFPIVVIVLRPPA